MDVRQIHEGNRDAWNRTALAGYGSQVEEHVQLIRQGGTNLMDAEIRILGDLRGKCGRAIHLQCSHGLDGLSLLNLGAEELVGIDISEEMLARAREKSTAVGARATWIRSDVLDTPNDLDGTADLVYTGKGAICWMMDLDGWAAVVSRLLKPGGTFFIFEGHPLNSLWEEEATTFILRKGATYFQSRANRDFGFPYAAALRHDSTKPVALTSRCWTVGETVTAVINAGMRIVHLEEFGEPFWDQFKQIPAVDLQRVPQTFALLATKQ